VRVIGEIPYEAIRVDDLARSADISRANFYHYFRNKHECYAESARRIASALERWSASLSELERGTDGLQSLRQWVHAYSRLCDRFGPLMRAWTLAENAHVPLGEAGQRMHHELVATMSARLTSGPGVQGDPGIAGAALMALVEQLMVGTKDPAHPQATMSDLVARMVYVAIFHEAPPAAANRIDSTT